ncbi:UNVERIFIED_CONTAM: hypothetical protein K2H54_062011 [Gekko kuhli]
MEENILTDHMEQEALEGERKSPHVLQDAVGLKPWMDLVELAATGVDFWDADPAHSDAEQRQLPREPMWEDGDDARLMAGQEGMTRDEGEKCAPEDLEGPSEMLMWKAKEIPSWQGEQELEPEDDRYPL